MNCRLVKKGYRVWAEAMDPTPRQLPGGPAS